MKKILVPIDFSKDSINALEHGIALAKGIGADVRIMYVKKFKKSQLPFIEGLEEFQGRPIEDYLDHLIEKHKGELKGNLDYKVREGKVFREVSNQAKYDDSHLIMMGTHGISGFEELWLGSNAFRVVSNAECPVLTVRHGFGKRDIKKIVLPIDITKESRLKVPFVAELAQDLGAEVHIIAIRETNRPMIIKKLDTYTEQVQEYVEGKGVKCTKEVLFGSNLTDITIEYALSINADLIAIMTEQAENTKNIWLGPYAQQMVNHSPIPILTYPSLR